MVAQAKYVYICESKLGAMEIYILKHCKECGQPNDCLHNIQKLFTTMRRFTDFEEILN